MKLSERMGTSLRTMVQVKVTTDGDRYQDVVKVAMGVWERGGRGVNDRVVTTCAVMVL